MRLLISFFIFLSFFSCEESEFLRLSYIDSISGEESSSENVGNPAQSDPGASGKPKGPGSGGKEKKKCESKGDLIEKIGSENIMNIDQYSISELKENFITEEGKYVVCHTPPGNPMEAHIIFVGSTQAVKAHLNHSGYYDDELYRGYAIKAMSAANEALKEGDRCAAYCDD